MKKSDKNILWAGGFIIVVVLIILVANQTIVINVPQSLQGNNNSSSNQYNYYYQNGTTPPVRPDLVQVAAPYFAVAPDAITACTTAGGTWTQTHDAVGCYGVGPINCGEAIYLAAAQQCSAVGATWTCSITNIHCAY